MAGESINRREMLAMMGGMASLLLAGRAEASPMNTSETMYTVPEDIRFVAQGGAPPKSVESAFLYSTPEKEGIYYALLRWYPGYMSATMCGGIRHLVDQQRRGLRPCTHGPREGRHLRATHRADLAL
jgi:hypothetical protein